MNDPSGWRLFPSGYRSHEWLGHLSFCAKGVRFDSLKLHVDVRHDELQTVAQERTTGCIVLDLFHYAPALLNGYEFRNGHVRSYGSGVVGRPAEDRCGM